jgi:NAD(P)-dependent dehydrogenase (short-subunit alcohol dehydrogenase family)
MGSASLFNVEGKIAVVTGASSGLGQGAASLLAAHGAQGDCDCPPRRYSCRLV